MPRSNLDIGRQSSNLDDEEFRRRLIDWLEQATPVDWRAQRDADRVEFDRQWVSAVRDAGFGPPHWEPEIGGPGLTVDQQIVFYETLARSDAPPYPGVFGTAYVHTHATLRHGTQEQRERFLPPILAAEEIWCQAFSEPTAGSDLASLRTRATRDGEHFILDGQKVWSSNAVRADWALVLARTDPSAPKRNGISYFIVDLTLDGVEVRPIRQLTGESEFAEIFFNDVHVPASCLIGAENDGWRLAQTTLTAERGPLTTGKALRLQRAADILAGQALEHFDGDSAALATSSLGQRVADAHVEAQLGVELMTASLRPSSRPASEASIVKLFVTELVQRLTGLGAEIDGLGGHVVRPTERYEMPTGHWLRDHYASWGSTISAGSSEIQRNLISERVLGLPRDPRVQDA